MFGQVQQAQAERERVVLAGKLFSLNMTSREM
jgi:hypothetical protein